MCEGRLQPAFVFRPSTRSFEVRDAYFRGLENLTTALVTTTTARGGGIYATPDFLLGNVEDYENVAKKLGHENDLVPRGVVIEYLPGHTRREVDAKPLRTRGLADGSLRYESNDMVVKEIIPTYRNGFMMRARSLVLARRFPEAIADYEQARELDPDDAMIQSELQAVLALRDKGGTGTRPSSATGATPR